jgi:hypothetical protein
MSTPFMPAGGTQAGEFANDYQDEHGQGLVTFAGVMLMSAAVLNTSYGIALSTRRTSSCTTRGTASATSTGAAS